MPLFVLLSGYTLYLTKPIYNGQWFLKKIYRLFLPIITWSTLLYFMQDFSFTGLKPSIAFPNSFLEFVKNLIKHPDWVFWFLWVIFVCMVIFFVTDKISHKFQPIFFVLIGVLLFMLPKTYLGIKDISVYFPIFVSGYYLSKYKEYVLKYLKFALLPAVVVYVVYVNQWTFDSSVIHKYILALTSIIIAYFIMILLRGSFFKDLLTYLGKNSLELYLCETICLNIGIGTGYLRIISIFISAFILSIMISTLLKSNKYTNFIAFGSFKKMSIFVDKKTKTA